MARRGVSMKFSVQALRNDAAQLVRRQRELLLFRFVNPARLLLGASLGLLAGGKASRSRVGALLISDAKETTSEEQLHPFSAYRAELKKRLNLTSVHLLLRDVLLAPKLVARPFDVILLKLSFRTSREEVRRVIEKIRQAAGKRPVIYLDGDDDICIQWPEILPLVDLYVKKQIFRDKSRYLLRYEGKSNLTDYVSKTYGLSFADNVHAQESRPLSSDQLGKVVVGGNIALDSNIMELYAKRRGAGNDRPRAIDVMFRGNVPKDWLYYLRKDIQPSLVRLQESYSVITPQKRVTRDEYLLEMINSKICLSPFGFGEICWRDFEAVICGCLIVKPDMGHIETVPNLFRPYETYVPVRWDYSDVYEQCSYYLKHADERERIVAAAYDELRQFYDDQRFLDLFSGILDKVGPKIGSSSNDHR
jgi:hypothetical protein